MFAELVLTALLALGAENLLFAGGAGFSRALRAAQHPGMIGRYAGFVAWFSLLSALAGVWLNGSLPDYGPQGTVRAACLAASAAAAYLVTAGLLRGFLPSLYKKCAPVLAPAAVNAVVLAMPYLQRKFSFDAAHAAAFAAGTGIAFYLAAAALMHAEAKCRNADMPEAFSGLPATLLYVGILSMAFAGFAGGRVF